MIKYKRTITVISLLLGLTINACDDGSSNNNKVKNTTTVSIKSKNSINKLIAFINKIEPDCQVDFVMNDTELIVNANKFDDFPEMDVYNQLLVSYLSFIIQDIILKKNVEFIFNVTYSFRNTKYQLHVTEKDVKYIRNEFSTNREYLKFTKFFLEEISSYDEGTFSHLSRKIKQFYSGFVMMNSTWDLVLASYQCKDDNDKNTAYYSLLIFHDLVKNVTPDDEPFSHKINDRIYDFVFEGIDYPVMLEKARKELSGE